MPILNQVLSTHVHLITNKSAFQFLIFATLLLFNSPTTAVGSTTVPPPPALSSFKWAEKSLNPPPDGMTAFKSNTSVTPSKVLYSAECDRCARRCMKAGYKQECFNRCDKTCRKGSSASNSPSTVNCNEQCGKARRCDYVPLCVQRCPEFCGFRK